MSKPILYSYFRSSASWRVRIALAYKGIEYEYKPINLIKSGGEQFSQEYKELNPISQVPTLVIDGQTLTQSVSIIEYLEEIQPGKSLLPKDPLKKFQARELAEIINSGIQPLQNLSALVKLTELFKSSPDDRTKWAHYWIVKGLSAYEKKVKNTSGIYSVGDEVSLADVCLIPQLYNATRNGVDLTQFPEISRIAEECRKLDYFKLADPSNQPDCPEELK